MERRPEGKYRRTRQRYNVSRDIEGVEDEARSRVKEAAKRDEDTRVRPRAGGRGDRDDKRRSIFFFFPPNYLPIVPFSPASQQSLVTYCTLPPSPLTPSQSRHKSDLFRPRPSALLISPRKETFARNSLAVFARRDHLPGSRAFLLVSRAKRRKGKKKKKKKKKRSFSPTMKVRNEFVDFHRRNVARRTFAQRNWRGRVPITLALGSASVNRESREDLPGR